MILNGEGYTHVNPIELKKAYLLVFSFHSYIFGWLFQCTSELRDLQRFENIFFSMFIAVVICHVLYYN